MLKKRYGNGKVVNAEADHFVADEEPSVWEAIVEGFDPIEESKE